MKPENRIASLVGLVSKVERFLDRMTKHRRRIGSEQHAHVTYGYQWEECWGKAMEEIRSELAKSLHGLPDPAALTPVANEWAYRKWEDHALRWSDEKDVQRYTAYYNGVKVGVVSYKLANKGEDGERFWDGYSTWFMDGRLKTYPETPEKGKQLVEAMFREFLTRASGDFGLDSENADVVARAEQPTNVDSGNE